MLKSNDMLLYRNNNQMNFHNAATAVLLYAGTEFLATGTYYASQTTNGM
jgi:hypothetical protein